MTESIRLVGGRRMQCKDIPDHLFLGAVRSAPATGRSGWRMRWDVQTVLEFLVGPVPPNLFLAKTRRLIERGLLGGCPCGCRGDLHLPEDCLDSMCCRADGQPRRRTEPVLLEERYANQVTLGTKFCVLPPQQVTAMHFAVGLLTAWPGRPVHLIPVGSKPCRCPCPGCRHHCNACHHQETR